MNKPIKSHLQLASEYLTKLRLEACLDHIDFALAERDDQQNPYFIGIRAAQISENSNKLLNLIDLGLLKIKGDRTLFLETAFKACKQMGLPQQCIALAEHLKKIGTDANRVDLLLYQADALLVNNDVTAAAQIVSMLVKKYQNNLECRLKAIECKRHSKDWDGARRIARRTTKLFPNEWKSHDIFVEECIRAGKVKKATRLYSAAIQDREPHTDSNRQSKTLVNALQYYSVNKEQTHSNKGLAEIKLVNQKIQLQWNASLGQDGTYQLVNSYRACEIIDQTIGHREVDLFRKCALPAMQADVIRVVHLAVSAHALYIDWPYRPFQLQTLLSHKLFQTENSVLAGKRRTQNWSLWNGFAYSNEKNDLRAFFTNVMEKIFYNIDHEISNNVFQVTGPAVWQEAYKQYIEDPQHKTIECITYPLDIYQVFQPALNKRPSMQGHWSRVQAEQSIFTDHTKHSAPVQQDQ